MIGKIYEVIQNKLINHNVYDESFKLLATLECGSTFVPLEVLEDFNPNVEHVSSKYTSQILKLKILTNDGKIGYTVFWEEEIQPAKTP